MNHANDPVLNPHLLEPPLNPGEPVEVRQVWAAHWSGPSYAWFAGYAFVSSDGKTSVVRHTRGTFAGVEINMRACDVRREREP